MLTVQIIECNVIEVVSNELRYTDLGNNVIASAHSQMEHYFFSYSLTWEIDSIEILEIMAQMWQYVIFSSLKPTKVTSDFILY